MKYTLNEAARQLGMSYSAVYGYCREMNLGGDTRPKLLEAMDLELIREQVYLKRRRRSKTFRLEERIESLELRLAELELMEPKEYETGNRT